MGGYDMGYPVLPLSDIEMDRNIGHGGFQYLFPDQRVPERVIAPDPDLPVSLFRLYDIVKCQVGLVKEDLPERAIFSVRPGKNEVTLSGAYGDLLAPVLEEPGIEIGSYGHDGRSIQGWIIPIIVDPFRSTSFDIIPVIGKFKIQGPVDIDIHPVID